jgi:hypothetical protein
VDSVDSWADAMVTQARRAAIVTQTAPSVIGEGFFMSNNSVFFVNWNVPCFASLVLQIGRCRLTFMSPMIPSA